MNHILDLLLAHGAAVILLWFTAISGAAAEPDKISLAYCTDCVPFHFQDKDGRPAGMIVDLWRLWSERTGIEIDFRAASWDGTLRMVAEGRADAHAGLFFSDVRARFLEYGAPLTNTETHFFVKKELPPIETVEDLAGHRVGVIAGDFVERFLKERLPAQDVIGFGNYEGIMTALREGKLQIFAADTPTGIFHLQNSGLGFAYEFPADRPLYRNDWLVAARKGNTELIRVIDAGMALITNDERREIERRWVALGTKGFALTTRDIAILAAIFGIVAALGAVIWIRTLRRSIELRTVELKSELGQRERAEEALEEAYKVIKNRSERMEDELNVGREIQMSMVPLTFPAFPDREEFTIYGALEPAREIGGDFYDFFFVDDDRLCFCIGDVSGKGVPAALFMAVTKTLIKSRATDDASTSSILTHVNDELSRDNPNGMFVTIFIAILNIRTGKFDYTNAGHNPPYVVRTDGPPQALADYHGPVIGAVKGMFYRKGTDVLRPGDLLYMYTDGVTEEMDANGQLFSDERLATFLNIQTIDSVEAAVDDTVAAVKSFRGEKDPEDDVTVLAIQYHGAPIKASAGGLRLIVKNEMSEITAVQERFREFGKAHGFPKDLERKLDMILDELLSNIIQFAFPEGGNHEIEITAEQVGSRLTVAMSDDGIPFNPLLEDPPDTSLAAKDRPIGGLGIHLVRSMTNDMVYQRHIDNNALTLVIYVDQSDAGS